MKENNFPPVYTGSKLKSSLTNCWIENGILSSFDCFLCSENDRKKMNRRYAVYEKRYEKEDEEKQVVTKIESDAIPIHRYECIRHIFLLCVVLFAVWEFLFIFYIYFVIFFNSSYKFVTHSMRQQKRNEATATHNVKIKNYQKETKAACK